MSTLDIAHFDPIEAKRQAKIGAMNLDELQKYLDDERDKRDRAAHAERRAHIDKLLEEIEEKRKAETKADAERRAKADPSNRVAEWLYAELGDKWSESTEMMRNANLKSVVAGIHRINRIEGDRAAATKHRDIAEMQVGRQDVKVAAATVRRTQIERDLVAAGFMHDVTPEIDD